MLSPINEALIGIKKRAERSDPALLVETFVDVGTLLTQLSTTDNQIIYGRRGTGKTHAFSYLAETRRADGDVAIYVDMRTIGSTGGLYGDPAVPIAERGTRLLIDTVGRVVEDLTNWILADTSPFRDDAQFARASSALDAVGAAITEVKVVGETEVEERATDTTGQQRETAIGGTLGGVIGAQSAITHRTEVTAANEERVLQRGQARQRVHFGELSRALRHFVDAIGQRRVWILLDEWAEVPRELQPLLADMLRRAFFPIAAITVKIGTIEHHTELKVALDHGYVGIDYGTDAAADVNLDDFMVFGADEDSATTFFRTLFFKHIKAVMTVEGHADQPESPLDMVRQGFTQQNAFSELVRAAEGVPRDAIYIAANAAGKAGNRQIGIPDIRLAAHNWYQRDKEAAIRANIDAYGLLIWIVEAVIGRKRIRGFLLRQDIGPQNRVLIEKLYDARVLHLVRRGYSARDEPGVRFNVYVLDYGCYVDLMNTQREPLGFLDAEDANVEVPPDDLRGIRHAVLDLELYRQVRDGELPF